MKKQQGVGMMEVLVALVLLAIGVLGFAALQLRAVDATDEAMAKVEAMNLARDVAERIRANRNGLGTYISNLSATTQSSTANPECIQTTATNPCTTATQMADYDTAKIVSQANSKGMVISLLNCQVAKELDDEGKETAVDVQARHCVYVAWGETKAINSSTDAQACTNGSAYLPQSKCIVMELY
ncbi:type IV pilus modification protein PilV [Acinetobacter wuhouensis]|uniref:type IV pilus modification protein PilV n=1 Tax=Acinetobacter wuhouensis TaxID=1879050 RepID=UPI00083BA23B|nr:type IV pilus modification protein PilV [Acinetobacter wuhouensis]AXQ20999.1 type IV pilus modification protein PilV [Acinetobacter wuhouensis]